jgi:16S rRNA (guanine966-N2)-methyltransferase
VATLRLSGGTFGGRRIAVPAGARPTEARVREALLDAWQDRLPGARLMELFAGSGAVALEALGRGAEQVVVVEEDRRAVETLKRNAAALGVEGRQFSVHRRSLPTGLRSLSEAPFDLIFADPPYAFADHEALPAAAAAFLKPLGELAVEHDLRQIWNQDDVDSGPLRLHRQRRYGESVLTFFRHPTEPGRPDD